MPIFDFACECGNKEDDVLVQHSQNIKCPKCGKEMERAFPDRVSFSWSNTAPMPPTASSKFAQHMRQKNFKKRIQSFEKMDTPVPSGVDVNKRYFGLEDNGIVGNRNYKEPTMKDYEFVEKKVKEKQPKIISPGT